MLNHCGTATLQTERLMLRRFRCGDEHDMFKNYAADAKVTTFLSWQPYGRVEDVRAYLDTVLDKYTRPDTYYWAIELDGEVVGSIAVIRMDERNMSCEMGYSIGSAYWRRGITSEAMRAVLAYLFGMTGMRRVMAKHDADNPASGRVMQKCGMTYEGRMRGHYLRRDGSAGDSLIYGILKDEFYM